MKKTLSIAAAIARLHLPELLGVDWLEAWILPPKEDKASDRTTARVSRIELLHLVFIDKPPDLNRADLKNGD